MVDWSIALPRALLPRGEPHELVSGEDVYSTVRPLLHFANPPFAVYEQSLFGDDSVALEHESHQVLPGHRTDEQVSPPRGEQVAGVEHHSRRPDGWHPVVARFLHARHRRQPRSH